MMRKIFFVIGLLPALLVLSGGVFAADLKEVRLWPSPEKTRVVFDVSDSVKYKMFSLKNPDRLVLDLQNSKLAQNWQSPKLKPSIVSNIRTGVQKNNTLRVVLELDKSAPAKSFTLKPVPNSDKGHRLVVDIDNPGYTPRVNLAERSKPAVRISADDVADQKRPIVVVIDAGHGGEDPGASGPGGLREKDIVLSISKELKRYFDATPGYKAYLTRTGDYYLKLGQRRDIARKYDADMFISVHADAFTRVSAHGASVFAVSRRGATSAMAKALADKENAADLIGGVSLADKDDGLANVLVDLSMTGTKQRSIDIGDKILKNVGSIARLHSKRVEQAAFAVLKQAGIPSLLVETGFISNPGEARKLSTSFYRRQMAKAIYEGVDNYFREVPPDGTLLAWLKNNPDAVRKHRITRGDTLSDIARRYQVSLASLKSANRLKSNTIRIGQTLVIPPS